MSDDMIVLAAGPYLFTYRSAGVCIHQDHVLLQQAASGDFWFLPGGRCHFGESSIVTLFREMTEELGVSVGIGRLLWILESFFFFDGLDHHELAIYHQMQLPEGCDLLSQERIDLGREENGVPLVFGWLPIDDLPGTRLYPTFFRTALRTLPPAPCHIIHHDEDPDPTA